MQCCLTGFLCCLKRRNIGVTSLTVAASVVVAAAAAAGFPCLEHHFVTVGPNHYKLGMHVSGDTSVSMKHV